MLLIIQNRLKQDHFNCLAFHGDVGPKERKENLSKFKSGTIRLLIASDVLARGIDIGDITHVINFDTPEGGYFIHFPVIQNAPLFINQYHTL
uniref:RNA helicase n=1 Tax=Meloidogyne incognita TaxID=6306 RepID=A0A914KSX8_MELIC